MTAFPDTLTETCMKEHLPLLLEFRPKLLEQLLLVLARTREDVWKA